MLAKGAAIFRIILFAFFSISVVGIALKFINKFVSMHNSDSFLIEFFVLFNEILLNTRFLLKSMDFMFVSILFLLYFVVDSWKDGFGAIDFILQKLELGLFIV